MGLRMTRYGKRLKAVLSALRAVLSVPFGSHGSDIWYLFSYTQSILYIAYDPRGSSPDLLRMRLHWAREGA